MIGQTLGRYRVLYQLGKGGMGKVYLARDESLDRSVALKILPPDLVKNDERVRRFVQEAKSASSLSHPNIVTIYEIGEADGVHFIAMEFVKGSTLKDLIHAKKTDHRTLIAYLAQAAEGVAKAHAAGIVHRDLKPENIMVSDEGFVKVLDFGLAKLIEVAPLAGDGADARPTATVRRTGDGVILGTIGYMSPEQIQAKPVDHRSDIFSFGCILYEAAARKRPFAADSDIETLHAIIKDTPAPVETLNPEVPTDVRKLVRRCLAKAPEQRLQSMKDLALELAEIVEEYDTLTTSSGSGGTTSISGTGVAVRRRSRFGQVGVVAAVVIGVSGVAFSAWTLLGGRRDTGAGAAPFSKMEVERLATIADLESASMSPDGRHLAYSTLEAGRSRLIVRQLATGRDLEVVPPQVNEIGNIAFSPDGNYVFYEQFPATLFQVASLGGAPRRIATPSLGLGRWDISPDGSQIAGSTRDKNIDSLVILNVDGTAPRTVATLKPGESLWTVAWSPDGQRIVGAVDRPVQGTRSGDRIVAFSVKDGSEQTVGSTVWSSLGGLSWLPDGSGLVVAGRGLDQDLNSQLWWVSWPDGTSRRITNDANQYHAATVSADSKSIAAVNWRSTASLWIAPMSNLQAATRVDGDDGEDFVSVRDGSVIFRRRERNRNHRNLWRLATDGRPPQRLTPARLDTSLAYPAAMANVVVFVSYGDEGGRTMWRMDLEGGGLAEIPGGKNKNVHAVSPDGLTVYFTRIAPRGQPADPAEYRMPVAGGAEEKVADNFVSWATLRRSPDAKYAFRTPVVRDTRPGAPDRREIVSAESGKVLRTLESQDRFVRLQWAPSSDALTFIREIDGVANILRMPIDGRPAQQITHFVAGQLSNDYGWLGDGTRLVFSRREQTPSEVLLIRNFR